MTHFTSVLLRMFELKSGKIEIDGVDIRSLDLESLRSHLSVIPQDSVLYVTGFCQYLLGLIFETVGCGIFQYPLIM